MKRFLTLCFAFASLFLQAQTSPTIRFDSIADMVAYAIPSVNSKLSAIVSGKTATGDSFLAGEFAYSASSTVATNTYSAFKPLASGGRWLRITGATWNQSPNIANPADDTSYAFQMERGIGTNVLAMGATATNTIIQTFSSSPLFINPIGANNLVLNELGGNVGIQKTVPTALLHVGAGTASNPSIKFTAGTLTTTPQAGAFEYNGTTLYFTDQTATRTAVGGTSIGDWGFGTGTITGPGTSSILTAGALSVGTSANQPLIFKVNGTEYGRVATGGNIGIGTTGPDRKLDILDANNPQFRLTHTDGTVYTDFRTLSTGHQLMTTSGGNRITSTTVNDTSVLARQVQGGLAFDGVTSGAGVTHTINAAAVSTDTSLSITFKVPESNPTVIAGLICIGSSSTTWNTTGSYFAYITTDGKLYIQRTSGVSSGQYVTDYIPNFVASYAGKTVNVTWVNVIGTPSMTTYVNGVLTATTYSSTGASAPTWALSFNASYGMIGKISSTELFNSTIYSATLFNRALSAAEVITLANQGVQEADKWGSLTPLVGPTTVNGGFETAGGGGADVFANWTEAVTGATIVTQETDARPGSLGTKSMKVVRSNSADGTTVQQAVSVIGGKKYQVSFWGKTLTSGRVNIVMSGSATMDQTLTTSWVKYYGAVFTALTTGSPNLQIFMTATTTGDYYIDDIEFTQVGSILDADLTVGVGYQVPDRSSNKYHGVVSASGTSWTQANRRGQIRYTTTGATTGAFQLLSGTAIPSNALIQSIVAWSAGTPLIYVGNATGTSNIVGHTTLAASTYTKLALTNDFSTTGNLWLNKSATNEVNLTVNYMIADP